MVTHDRIRLTGLLREKPWKRGFFYQTAFLGTRQDFGQAALRAVLLYLDFSPASVQAVPLLARTAGVLTHLAEEQQQPIGFLMAGSAEKAIRYEHERGQDYRP